HMPRELVVRTTFNLLGPLTNPARAPFQLLGVWHASLLERVAAALVLLGIKQAWVVHGADGLDEVTITGETFVAACSARTGVETFAISPKDFGLERRSFDGRHAGGVTENARLIRAILQGKKNGDFVAARDLVIINAAAALYLEGVATDLRQAAGLAHESIDSGHAASKLDALIRETNRDRCTETTSPKLSTDEEYFGGSIADLSRVRTSTGLPVLRKDFIIDPIQLYEGAVAGADAALLVAGALDDAALTELRALAEDELGLDALVEVHTSEELRRSLNAGARIIGVNNRDLRTFRVSLNTSERLIAEAPRDRIMISESGLQSAKSLRHLQTL